MVFITSPATIPPPPPHHPADQSSSAPPNVKPKQKDIPHIASSAAPSGTINRRFHSQREAFGKHPVFDVNPNLRSVAQVGYANGSRIDDCMSSSHLNVEHYDPFFDRW